MGAPEEASIKNALLPFQQLPKGALNFPCQTQMGTASEGECALKVEAMRKEDCSWHPCRVSFSPTECGLIIEFESQDFENMLLHDEEALECLRFRSVPLQGDDCSRIKEGVHVLAAHKSQFRSCFYDAKVEKVVRVRHSKRIHCRCTFTIKWLCQDLENTLTVPSSSIMKLAPESIIVHPAVAMFLKSVKQIHLCSACPCPTILEESDGELDLNKLLEKQVEEISSSANAFKDGILEDILLEVKVNTKGDGPCNAEVSKVSISHVQVPCDHNQNQVNTPTQNPTKLHMDMQLDDQSPPGPSFGEELLENRSHLSPLAARAALASLMSSDDKHIALDGMKMFNSSVFKDRPTKDEVSLERSDGSILIVPESLGMVNPLSSTESRPQLVAFSSEVTTKVNRNDKTVSEHLDFGVNLGCLSTERNLSQPTKAARITRSASWKGTVIQNNDIRKKACFEDMSFRATANKRRFTRSAVNGKREHFIVEDKRFSDVTEPDSPEGSPFLPESSVSKESSRISTEKKAISSPLDAGSHILTEGGKRKQMSHAVKTLQQNEGCVNELKMLSIRICVSFPTLTVIFTSQFLSQYQSICYAYLALGFYHVFFILDDLINFAITSDLYKVLIKGLVISIRSISWLGDYAHPIVPMRAHAPKPWAATHLVDHILSRTEEGINFFQEARAAVFSQTKVSPQDSLTKQVLASPSESLNIQVPAVQQQSWPEVTLVLF
ncbi:hypothetical protein CJ030_MR2G021703 [Morella rubra]|uniref:SAWADEE domain-containing protein n=1 Tax=Morella rubra TaxID=262757 RepID=A0A6A1WFS4_9ROSI|nr:hypothetical protein CJ030_MR2G021703 [Morella rubra]